MLIKKITGACLTSMLLLLCGNGYSVDDIAQNQPIANTSTNMDALKVHIIDILKNEETCEEIHLSSRQEAGSSIDVKEDRIASLFVEEYVNSLIAGLGEHDSLLMLYKAIDDHKLGDDHINPYVSILHDEKFMNEIRDMTSVIKSNIENKRESFCNSLEEFLKENRESVKLALMEHSEDKRRLLYKDVVPSGEFEYAFTGLLIALPKFNLQQYPDGSSKGEKIRGLGDILQKSNCSIFVKYFAKDISECIIDLL
ncbi:MAG: hypothetical protein LBT67_02835 [Holosporaceae bacterium]|nr:hypothetical protein [Holosporaceae bacterium]